jgi:nucleoside-diphosphate-sugar epimerase
MSDRVLVTGATGCLGSNLVMQLLRDGTEVVIFKPYGDKLGPLRELRRSFEVRLGDVRDTQAVFKALAGIRRVYHFAGVCIPTNRLERLMWEVNVVGVHNVLAACARCGVERVVHVSSTAAIGYPPDGEICNESFDIADSVTDNAYSITKRCGERVALGFNGKDLQVVCVNPAAVIAPGGDTRYGWSGVVAAAARGLLRAVPSGGSSFCSSEDMVTGVIRAMQVGRPGERYILSSQNMSYRDLGRLVAAAVGVAPPRFRVPNWVLRGLGHINAWITRRAKVPVLAPENVDLMTRTLYYDQSKAVRELGMSQTPVLHAIEGVTHWIQAEAQHALA